ncbi:MAG TPA: outer membrane lipoprotein chaperone LolA [Burkholderiales bacterium]|nr:outer membrane lipoprotein chaperone LolA [Burkholderiales bacterium]
MRTLVCFIALVASSVQASSLEQFRSFVSDTQSARAQFEQKVYDRGGKLTQEAKGSFVFQRPGRFRWVYEKPADQIIVGDGARVWIYDRELNQVTVRKLSAALGSTPAALLSGSADVAKAFELGDAGARDGLQWLEAVPRDRDAGFERMRIGFGPGGALEAMQLVDHFGQTTHLRFSKVVRNPKVDAKEFRFDPPKGADVLGER